MDFPEKEDLTKSKEAIRNRKTMAPEMRTPSSVKILSQQMFIHLQKHFGLYLLVKNMHLMVNLIILKMIGYKINILNNIW